MTSTVTRKAQRIVGALGRMPLVSGIVRRPPVRAVLEKIPGVRSLYDNGWERIHPFDRRHGTNTSGFVSPAELPDDEGARVHAICYAGSQPSLLRRALAALPPVDSCTFVDLGCGKGRALLVATEFPFRAILGVELSAPLARIARRNASLIGQHHPQRTAVSVVVGDASVFPLPAGDLVLFLYHPFDATLVARVVAGIEAALAAERRSIYVIYYNPVAGRCFDASPKLRRRFARTLEYDAVEHGFGPDESDVVVIWQGGTLPPASAPANARIVPVEGGLRVILENRP